MPDMPRIKFRKADARVSYVKDKRTFIKKLDWPEITCTAMLDQEYTWNMFKYNYTASTIIENQPNPQFQTMYPIFNYFYSYIEDRDTCEYRRVLSLTNKFMNYFEKCYVICDEFQVESLYQYDDNIVNLHQLNAGKRKLLNLCVALATQMQLTNYDAKNFNEAPGIVLIDNIDTFIYPEWQWKVLDALTKTFPNVQFIVTTQSPIILASTHINCINMEGWTIDCYGLSPNEILTTVLTSKRYPEKILAMEREFASAIKNKNFDSAKKLIEEANATWHANSEQLLSMNITLDLEQLQ